MCIKAFGQKMLNFIEIILYLQPKLQHLQSVVNFFNSNGAVAQLVEQRTENPCVGGSIPPHTTKAGTLELNPLFPFLFSGQTCFRRAK
jgi:hypothetical protein